MRDPKALSDMAAAGVLPDPYHRPVSRRAIAASTGLARETVRRKIADLIQGDYLVQERAGVRTRAGLLLEMRHLEFVRTLIDEIRRCGMALERIEREERG